MVPSISGLTSSFILISSDLNSALYHISSGRNSETLLSWQRWLLNRYTFSWVEQSWCHTYLPQRNRFKTTLNPTSTLYLYHLFWSEKLIPVWLIQSPMKWNPFNNNRHKIQQHLNNITTTCVTVKVALERGWLRLDSLCLPAIDII